MFNLFQSNYTKFLKNLHTEQIAKLHAKNQHECDLLEDLRTYTIKRSAIEKSYSEVSIAYYFFNTLLLSSTFNSNLNEFYSIMF